MDSGTLAQKQVFAGPVAFVGLWWTITWILACSGYQTGREHSANAVSRSEREQLGGDAVLVEKISPGLNTAWSPFVFRPTQHLGDCDFAGSVRGVAAGVLADLSAQEPVALLQDAHFALVRLPERPSEPTMVDIEWPVVGRFYLDSPGALRVGRDVPLVPGHLTVPRYAKHHLFRKKRDAAVFVQLGAEGKYEVAVPCEDLTLEDNSGYKFGARPSDHLRGMTVTAPLYRNPGNGSLGDIGSFIENVEVLDRRNGWVHVKGVQNLYVHFDGWLREKFLKPEPTYLVVLREDPIRPTHRTAPGAQIVLDGKDTGIVVADQTYVIVGEPVGGFVHVAIAGVHDKRRPITMRLADLVPVAR